ncbi:hypothetical protein J1N10_18260 [Carboxylicivirga sp. A043]|uniref:hypothetical protein n=1 Tax=Carboxylicivirga litoralis TaxID=2816963 RepID=UPI0021CB889C|nr:hypothetical protein [Carboxylicivirga sp. A043]MCU4157923.1 hypothetical protein [Carboxylicivirga sp. A043]
MRYKLLYLLISFLTLFVYAQAQTLTEEIKRHESFYVLPSSTLEVNNKYGNIHFSTWDKDSVDISINFFISEKNEARFNKIKDNVQFKITGNSAYMMAETVFGSKYASFFKNIKEVTNLQIPDNSRTRIDYFVKVPAHINLKVNNRYGNIFIPDFAGNLNINLSNGDFQGHKITGNNNLTLAFGDVMIESMKQTSLNLNFSKVNINSGQQLDIVSKSSVVKIDQCDLIKLQSKRDDYQIDELSHLFGESYFSKLSILNLKKEFNMVMQYGALKHLGMDAAFDLLKINSKYANCNVEITQPRSYSCAIMAPKSDINIPKDLKASTDNWQDKIENETIIFNYNNLSAKEKVQILIDNASLKIDHK